MITKKPTIKKKVKDFDFNKSPSVKKSKAHKLHGALEKHYTSLPYEIEGDYKPTSWLNDKPNITRLEMYVAIFLGLLLGNVISDLIN